MRVIFSVYIDFEETDFEINADFNKNIENKNEFKNNYDFLKRRHEEYAEHLGIKYILYENDDKWKDYRSYFEKNYPFISKYNIINFYKIQLMYDLSEIYDEVLYLDFDVVPLTKENIFKAIGTNNGIACKINHERNPRNYFTFVSPKIIKETEEWYQKTGITFSERDPRAKYWNCKALLIEAGYDGENDVYNTGIVLANKYYLKKLRYFENFKDTLEFMHEVKSQESIFPKFIQKSFGYDNETLFSFKMKVNKMKLVEIDDKWHWPYRRTINFIPKETKMVHVICKNFEYVKKYVEKHNL